MANGLLGSPLLGTATTCTADWCHAWSILGQWSGHVTFPVPASRVWPRNGHLRKILDAYQGRQPHFYKWARSAFEQGALPTLSILPGEVAVRVLPGDKMYQAMTIKHNFMRPAILHGFGTSAKRQLPQSLIDLAPEGWIPFFCSNALIALARSLCKCLLAQLITASGANAVKGYLARCACIDGTIP